MSKKQQKLEIIRKIIKKQQNTPPNSIYDGEDFESFFIGYDDKKIGEAVLIGDTHVMLKGVKTENNKLFFEKIEFERLTENSLDLVIKNLKEVLEEVKDECH